MNRFSKTLYMTREEVEEHAKNYSQSYSYDLRSNRKSSVWSTNFDKMVQKTVLKLLLKNWGVKSVEMQQALAADFSVVTKDNFTYPDNGNNSIPREEYDITPEETEIVQEESADADNPFEEVDAETGEILSAE